MALLESSHYPAIRAAIDISLDSATVSDAIISLDVFVGAAERETRQLIADADTATGVRAQQIRTVAILLTAANLAPSIPSMTNERFGEYSYSRPTQDMNAVATRLRQQAHALALQLVNDTDPSGAATPLPVFGLAHGRRV